MRPPRVEMRIGDYVVVIISQVKNLKVNNDVRDPVEWADSYEAGSMEHKCFVLAKERKAIVTQVHAEDSNVRFHFRFLDDATAKVFCKELEEICNN